MQYCEFIRSEKSFFASIKPFFDEGAEQTFGYEQAKELQGILLAELNKLLTLPFRCQHADKEEKVLLLMVEPLRFVKENDEDYSFLFNMLQGGFRRIERLVDLLYE